MITAGLCRKDDVFKNGEIFDCFSEWCESSSYPIVLMIDEVDTATNNQVFLDFLAQLRAAYLDGDVTPAFQSVILAGYMIFVIYRGNSGQMRSTEPTVHGISQPDFVWI